MAIVRGIRGWASCVAVASDLPLPQDWRHVVLLAAGPARAVQAFARDRADVFRGRGGAADREPDDGLLRLRVPAALRSRFHPGRPRRHRRHDGQGRDIRRGGAQGAPAGLRLVRPAGRHARSAPTSASRAPTSVTRRRRHNFDCFDTTRNAASLLLVLREWGLLRHHTVADPRFRGNLSDRPDAAQHGGHQGDSAGGKELGRRHVDHGLSARSPT